MLSVFGGLFLLIAAGIATRFIKGFPEPKVVRQTIGKLVITFFLPALVFNAVYTAHITRELLIVPGVAIIVSLSSLGLSLIAYNILFKNRLRKSTIGTLVLAGTWCNATYLGLPIVTSVMGMELQQVPIAFDLMGMTLTLFTVGTIIAVEYGTTGIRHTFSRGLLEVIRLPPVISLLLALGLNVFHVVVPQWILETCRLAGGSVIPLMLFSVGLALVSNSTSESGDPGEYAEVPLTPDKRGGTKRVRFIYLIPAIVIKLIIAPIIGYTLILWFITDQAVAKATLLETAMPTMVLTMVFAERYGLDEETLARVILITTVLSTISLPYIASLQ